MHIQNYYSEMLQKLSSTTVLYHHRILHEALKHAVKWQIIIANPTDAVEAPKKTKTNIQVLNEQQVNTLLESVKETEMYMPILIAVTTGIRRGELLGLEWKDISISKNKISLNGEKNILIMISYVNGKMNFN